MKKKVDKNKPCNHLRKVYFKYMDGFFCYTCDKTYLDGRWVKSKNKKSKTKT